MSGAALDGVRVLDLTRLLPGPYASLLLADLGAEVIKVEQPGRGDYLRGIAPYRFAAVNRNKKSITLDLKAPEGRELFYRLVKTADVVMEGNRPGVMERLGADYETLKGYKTDIIYCSISGYGQNGPYMNWTGHDINYMAVAGALAMTGEVTPPPALPIADFSSGMFAVIGILAALQVRQRTGQGQMVDVSMTDGVVSWMTPYLVEYEKTRTVPLPHWSHYGLFRCRDGRYVSIGIVEDWFWENFCRVAGRPEWSDDPRFKNLESRTQHAAEVESFMNEVFLSRDAATWVQILNDNDVPCAPVNSLEEVISDPQLRYRGMVDYAEYPEEGRMLQVGHPVRLSQTPASYYAPPPRQGEHNESVFAAIGVTTTEYRALQSKGVV